MRGGGGGDGGWGRENVGGRLVQRFVALGSFLGDEGLWLGEASNGSFTLHVPLWV